MGERDAAQAAVLIRALSDVRDKMISRMTWPEDTARNQKPRRCGEMSMKRRPTSLVCSAAIWAEMSRQLNPLARPGSAAQFSRMSEETKCAR
jgi:hypothetical protein